jgi:hypothetical protein
MADDSYTPTPEVKARVIGKIGREMTTSGDDAWQCMERLRRVMAELIAESYVNGDTPWPERCEDYAYLYRLVDGMSADLIKKVAAAYRGTPDGAAAERFADALAEHTQAAADTIRQASL